MINNVSTISNSFYNNTFSSPYTTNQSMTMSPVYQADKLTLNTELPPKPGDLPPYEPPPENKSFFQRPEVKVAGMLLGSGIAFGAIGAAIGSAAGNVAAGAAIGAGIGIVAPIVLAVIAIKAAFGQ